MASAFRKLLVRSPVSLGNVVCEVPVLDDYTVWMLKIKISEQIPLPPSRQILSFSGNPTEFDNDSKIRDILSTQRKGANLSMINIKEREEDKKARGKKQKHGFKALLGKKMKESVNAKLSFASGRGVCRGVVGIKSDFRIYSFSNEYQQCVSKDLRLFDVDIRHEVSGNEITEICYAHDPDGSIIVSWTPTEAGNYKITVRVFNEDLCLSPYTAEVVEMDNGAKVKSFLKDPTWAVEMLHVVCDWASKETKHRMIFEEVGIASVLEVVGSVPEELVNNLILTFLERLIDKDSLKDKLLQQGSKTFIDMAKFATDRQSVPLNQFISRSLASFGSLAVLESDKKFSNSPFGRTMFEINMHDFVKVVHSMFVLPTIDDLSRRNLTRAIAALTASQVYMSAFSDGSMEVFDRLVQLAQNHKIDLATRRYALQAIANFSGSHDSFQSKHFNDAVCKFLFSTCDQPFVEDSLVIEAIRALANLSKNVQFTAIIAESAAFERAVNLLADTDMLTNWEATSTLARLPNDWDKEDFKRSLVSEYYRDQRFNLQATRLLTNIIPLAQEHVKVRALIRSVGVIRNLIEFLNAIDVQLQAEAAKAICALAEYDECKKTFVDIGGVDSLCVALSTGSTESAAHVLAALTKFPLDLKGGIVYKIGDSGISKLLSVLKQGDREIQGFAAILLVSLAGNEESRANLVRQGGAAFLSNLIELVRSGKVNVQNFIPPDEIKKEKKIGEGVSGTVWKAKWLDRDVAVKVFDEDGLGFNRAEFMSELALMSVLRHENIVHCLGCCSSSGNLYIVSEFFKRGSLTTVIQDKSIELTKQLILRMAIDAAQGLAYLHSLGIIHRDIKNGNMLVTEDYRVKVTDFGLSRVADKQMTRGVGTPIYTAPEVLKGNQYSQKADVYSFAFILWEMITRKTPYEGMAPFEAVSKVCEQHLRPPIPANCMFEQLIVSCWDKDPEKRPTFDEITKVLRDLQQVVDAGDMFDEDEEEDMEYVCNKAQQLISKTIRHTKRSTVSGAAAQQTATAALAAVSGSKSNFATSSTLTGRPTSGSQAPLPTTSATIAAKPEVSANGGATKVAVRPRAEPTRAISRSATTQEIRAEEPPTRSSLASSTDARIVRPPPSTRPKPNEGSLRGKRQESLDSALADAAKEQPAPAPAAAPAPAPAPAPTATPTTHQASVSTATGEICPKCKLAVLGRSAIKAMGATWHNTCFVCTRCTKPFSNGFLKHEGAPYCHDCYRRNYAHRCARCQQPLSPPYVNALDQFWHKTCFVCIKCNQPMQNFYEVDGQPMCDKCGDS